MTAARYDLVVWALEIPLRIRESGTDGAEPGRRLAGGRILWADCGDWPRSSWSFALAYTPDLSDQRLVTMPHVYESGHSVTMGGPEPDPMHAPADLLEDVMLWYSNSPH